MNFDFKALSVQTLNWASFDVLHLHLKVSKESDDKSFIGVILLSHLCAVSNCLISSTRSNYSINSLLPTNYIYLMFRKKNFPQLSLRNAFNDWSAQDSERSDFTKKIHDAFICNLMQFAKRDGFKIALITVTFLAVNPSLN